ncbi:translocation/assembly module TamB domain-containing protein [Roseovarius nanhaiticus]|uniref:translocation/assembly module TamB domain-containing protein n=1 Tax=Roseovarius nanhaiticus TaxID=573024 RepID=UPI002491D822|nr:translocation/assembly module TamB domain-containing protein [Roseovarius nanhaiticus]
MTRAFTARILCALTLAASLMTPQMAAAQEDEDRGLLQGFIEDNLSGAGRSVRIEGFEGALSSEATLDLLTVADDRGVWLTLRDVTLNWSRLALLRGRLEVTNLSAAEILLPRLPDAEETVEIPDAEATGFSLPELPVSINVEEVSVERLVLGAPLVGEEVILSLLGSVQLADGAGNAQLDIGRIDRDEDAIKIAVSYANETRNLGIDIDWNEEEGGIASKLMGIPGAPSLSLTVKGDAPLSDFTAEIALDTAGERRLGGTVTIEAPAPAEVEVDAPLSFAADVRGDIAPVFAPEYREFFGTEMALVVEGSQPANGGLGIQTLSLTAAALTLDGSLQLAADGWPERFDLTGRIASNDGKPVLLPLAGERTTLDNLDLVLDYDLNEGENWNLSLKARGLERIDVNLEQAVLEGGGKISRGGEGEPSTVDGALDLAIDGLALVDPGLSTALGNALRGDIVFDWTEGDPFRLSELSLTGSDYDITGKAAILGLTEGETPRITANVAVEAADIERFADLAGTALDGAVNVQVDGGYTPSNGNIEATVTGSARDLAVGQPRLDPLLRGTTQLDVAARRNGDGTFLDRLNVTSPTTDLTASAAYKSDGSEARIELALDDASLIEPALQGPARLTARADQDGNIWTLKAGASGPGEATVTADGTIELVDLKPGIFDMRASAVASDFAPYSALAGRDLGGAASVVVDAQGNAGTLSGQADIVVNGQDLSVDIPQLDPILRGTSSAEISAQRSADGALTLSKGLLTTPKIDADVTGYMGADGTAQGTADITGNDLAIGIPQVDRILAGRSRAQIEALRSAEGTITLKRGEVETPMLDATATGFYAPDGAAEAQVDVTGNNLAIGIPQVDQLLRGTSSLKADVARRADGTIVIEGADLDTSQLTADASGTLGTDGNASATIDARLANVALFAPGIPGPATVSGTVRGDGGGYIVDLDGTGPAGITADVSGRIANDGNLDLSVNGRAPLALANSFIEPRSLSGIAQFDLRVNGPPAPSSVTGTITTSGAGLALPKVQLALEGISADIRLTGGAAQIAMGAGISSGGRIAVNGRVGLAAPYQADVAVDLLSVGLTDPGLYTTTANGGITFNGPALGGATIAGIVNLAEVNVQVPSGAISSGASLPGLKHVNEPAAVRRTRAFADLLETGGSANGGNGGGGGPVYNLDVNVNAFSQIFIRGRGLDAELGGSLRVRGTTANVIPEGQFSLIRGRLDLLGKRLDLTEGSLRLQGSFVPFLRLVAQTESGDINISIIIEGPADEPEITFQSQPELPQDQVVSQLIFGRDLSQISAFQAVQLASAVATLTGRGNGGVVGSLREGIGLDNLDVTTGANDQTEVRAGKYLSENVYSEVEVDSDGQTQINLNLRINKRLKAKGSFSADGNSGLGVFFEKDY